MALNWETASAQTFTIQGSNDGATFTDISPVTAGAPGVQTVTVSGAYRWVRMAGLTRATRYGYSLWEFQVFAAGAAPTTGCGSTNWGRGRPALASSVESDATRAENAFDVNGATRWSSQASDPQWLQVDLGSYWAAPCRLTLNWETAYAKTFKVQASQDGVTFTDVTPVLNGVVGSQTVSIHGFEAGFGRYVRVVGLTRATSYGYSLWEMNVNVIEQATPGVCDPCI